ncbi:MAG: hypothetical protein RMJ45_08780, partial [Candidatus Calescibacterium sp.]|nr:hypothetical protein [Candidatus Calescibacterium sp.]
MNFWKCLNPLNNGLSRSADAFIKEITMKVEWIEDLGDKRIVGNNILASDNNSDLKNSERFI